MLIIMSKKVTMGMILENKIDSLIRIRNREEYYKNNTPKPGPRMQYLHYINDLSMEKDNAIKKIIEEYPEYSQENIEKWDKEDKEGKGRKRSDEGR